MIDETVAVIKIPHRTYVAKRIEWPANTVHEQTPLMFQGREWWNVCRVMEDPLEPLHHAIVPISFGHSADSALTMITTLNDGLKAVREVVNAGSHAKY